MAENALVRLFGREAATRRRNELSQAFAPKSTPIRDRISAHRQQVDATLGGTTLQNRLAMLGSTGVPVLSDVAGLAADAMGYAGDPSSRTPANYGLSALGLLPFVPGIVKPSTAKALTTKMALPDGDDFAAAVANTPGAQITEDGLMLRVARRQKPEMDNAESVRTGVFYLPAGDKRMSYYTGKNGYGGSVKHEGETLLRNPLFVKGATGGKAPEAAYDSLRGKGAYEAMRTDVLNATMGYGLREGQKVERVASVLEKYGADPSLANYIANNSKEGNTLAYALQENIVAHAVRAAGHDGVLGYTRTKSGPVISELFDTRELTYPSQFSDPDIHPAYSPE